MNTSRSSFCIILVAVAVVCGFMGLHRLGGSSAFDAEPSGEARVTRYDDVDQWLPEVRTGGRPNFEVRRRTPVQPDGGEERLKGIQHRGPLVGRDLVFAQDLLGDLVRERTEKLEKHRGEETLQDLAVQAELLADLQLYEGFAAALASGSYLVFDANADSLLPNPEGGAVLNVGAAQDSHPVLVSLIVTYSDFPEVRAAQEYRDQLAKEFWKEQARIFNSLAWEERKRRIQLSKLPEGLRAIGTTTSAGDYLVEPVSSFVSVTKGLQQE